MKKHFYSLFAAAAMMLAVTSCSQEEDFGQQSSGDLTKFSVVLEGATQSRAAGDGTQVDELYYEVWSENGETPIVNQTSVAVENGRAIVELPLMKNEKYDIIFWAQSSETSIYTVSNGLKNISVNYENIAGNNEENDAFFNALDDYQPKGTAQTVELRRPFAQLNIGTSLDDWKKANLLVEKDGTQMVDQISVKVTGLASTFNAMTGEASAIKYEAVEFTKANLFAGNFTTNETDYKYFAMNYLLVPGKKDPQGTNNHEADSKEDEKAKVKSNVDIEFTLYKGDNSYSTINVPNAPIQRNYRTNIIGAFLTGGETIFEVIVMPGFDEEDILYPELLLAATNGGTVTLEEDVELKGSLVVAADKSMTINLNGHSITNTSSTGEYGKDEGIIVYGNLTIEGEGTVEANSMAIWARGDDNNAEVTIKGGTYKGLSAELANSGRSVIYASGNNTINIYGGTFEAKAADKTSFADKTNGVFAALNIQDNNGNINVYGGTFINFNPAVPGTEPTAWNADHENGFVAEGYSSVKISDEDGKTVYQVVKGKNATNVTEAESLKTALTANQEEITVVLGGNLAYEVAAWANDAMGGVTTKTITIDGLGKYTLTFNQTNSDWNNIVTNNGAKLILKNMKITNSGHNNGPWNRHDLNFGCDVEMENVASDKAIALKADGVLKNVTINDANTSDTYALWIQPNGQTVTLDNCTIDMIGCTDGRGIKIDEQYVTEPALVTLNVSNTTFKTEEKAAIIVKSAAGANIYLNNVNITDVAADSKNVVWVDEASSAFYNLVTVTGGTKILEGNLKETDGVYYVSTAAQLKEFAGLVNTNKKTLEGKTVKLVEDIDLDGIDWEPIGQTGATTFNGIFDGQNHTISNLSVNSADQEGEHYSSGLFGWVESHSKDHGHIKNVKIAGAVITGHHNCGALVGYITQETALVENCHVTKAEITCTSANNDADGDKAGALIGNATVATPVRNCTATNSTVSANRDAGQIVGAANESKVTGCSATDVKVTAYGTSTSTTIRNEIIGRVLQ